MHKKWMFKFLAIIWFSFLSTNLQAIIVPPQPSFSVPPPDNIISDLLPFVLVNDSEVSDDDVYIFISGADPANTLVSVFGEIDQTTGEVSFTPITASNVNTINSLQFSLPLSSLPLAYPVSNPTSTDRVVYLPFVSGGLIWYSINAPLNMPGVIGIVPPPGENVYSYQQPAFNNPQDPNGNYYTQYSNFEFAYLATPTQVVGDLTAVSYFGLPLYAYISTPDANSRTNTGLYQSLNEIFTHVLNLFNPIDPNQAPANLAEREQWNRLVLYTQNGIDVLRVLAPAKSISAGVIPPLVPMDPNYFDNQPAYSYSYYLDILDFYRTNQLRISLAGTTPSGDTYVGNTNSNNTITLTGLNTGNVVTIPAPTPPDTAATSTTTYSIFAGTLVSTSSNPDLAADAVQISQLFEDSIIPGLLPTDEEISLDFLSSSETDFYEYNQNLNTPITSGPWYDLYSKAFHSLGYIYTYAFDEPLWPQVQVTSQFLLPPPNPTFMAIRLGSVATTGRTKSRISIRSSDNPASVGTPVRFTISIDANALFGPIRGYVIYSIDGVTQPPIELVNGQAETQPFVLSPGRHLIKGVYTGDAKHFASRFRRLTQFITSSNLEATKISLRSSENPSEVGEKVTFTAFVRNFSRNSEVGPPTGSVNFKIDGVDHIVPLDGHRASLSTSELESGRHHVRAIYSGDATHLESRSKSLTQIVNSVAPPRNLRVFQIKKCFPVSGPVNVITWKAPATPVKPVAYNIYRDSDLKHFLAKVPAAHNQKKFQYKDDHIRPCKTYRYFIVSVGENGDTSTPVEVVYHPCCHGESKSSS